MPGADAVPGINLSRGCIQFVEKPIQTHAITGILRRRPVASGVWQYFS